MKLLAATVQCFKGYRCAFTITAALLASLAAVALVLMLHTGTAWAAPPEVAVEVLPDTVTFSSAGAAQALVVVRNASSDPLQNVQLSWFADVDTVTVTNKLPPLEILAPNGEHAWKLQLAQQGRDLIAGTVYLRVDYIWQAQGQPDAAARVVSGSFKVKSYEAEAIERIADVQVRTSLASLNQQRPGELYLVVTNKSSMPITVTDVLVQMPDFITTTRKIASVRFAPHETHAIFIDVKATDAVRPGKYLLVFEVAFDWGEKVGPQRANIVTTHEVDVGVLGESDILTALAVPSFLFLPGVLAIITLDLLWRRFGKKSPQDQFLLKAASAEYWFVAITLSLLMAFLYPELTERIVRVRRNYLDGYGFTDVVWVWFASVLLAILGYFVVKGGINPALRGVVKLIQIGERWYQRRKVRNLPASDDSYLETLRKLGERRLGIWLDLVRLEGEEQPGYLLYRNQELFWVAPAIEVEWLTDDSALRSRVQGQLGAQGDPIVLAQALEEGERQGVLKVRWQQIGRVQGPYSMKADSSKLQNQKNRIVQELEE